MDIILFSEVMYDLTREISGENPEHIKFIKNTGKIFESWGYEVRTLRAEKDYLSCFHRIIEKPRKHMERRGMKFGFPVFGRCGVKRDCKEKPVKDFLKRMDDEIVQYVGICADETRRLESLHRQSGRVSLLEKYGYTEEMARKKCLEYGLLSPCYKYSSRGGCWFCPNAKPAEHRQIRKLYPKIWKEFVSLEKEGDLANNKWNIHGLTLGEIDDRLFWEEQQVNMFDYMEKFCKTKSGKCKTEQRE